VQNERLLHQPEKLFQAEWRETLFLLGGVLYHNGVAKVDRMVSELLDGMVVASEGFSGAEIEQSVVSALYAAHATGDPPVSAHVLSELARTRPLSVVMDAQIQKLKQWAESRTVPVD